MSLASESIVDVAALIHDEEEQRGVAATRGHLAGNGGLRGHSVGGVFPCVIYATGNIHAAPPVWNFKSPDGVEHTGFISYEDAEAAAQIWLEEREV
ncbi:hypothetical protein [Escherichia phage Lidtsur]|uniref:Uncharacterized protein n=1 Tax=Escherichia phage Lidtsur TaxID=2562235 RepID=A0A4D6E0N5_9CAUD|nr:hypothetical protein HOV34_gp15 [Escherichia phage Lidtsur]QBZ71519.1 hypothetical protein [Escherichia phage Lidtsur]